MAPDVTFFGSDHGFAHWTAGELRARVEPPVVLGDRQPVVRIEIGSAGATWESVNLTPADARALAVGLERMAAATSPASDRVGFESSRRGMPTRRSYRKIDASVVAGDYAPDGQTTIRLRIGDPLTMDQGALASVDLPHAEARRLAAHVNSLVREIARGDAGLGAA